MRLALFIPKRWCRSRTRMARRHQGRSIIPSDPMKTLRRDDSNQTSAYQMTMARMAEETWLQLMMAKSPRAGFGVESSDTQVMATVQIFFISFGLCCGMPYAALIQITCIFRPRFRLPTVTIPVIRSKHPISMLKKLRAQMAAS
jgi:hypothetical protein